MTSVAFSPDGTRIAVGTGGFNRYEDDAHPSCIIWDAKTGAKLQTIPGRSGGTPSLAFSPDGRRIALAFREDVDLVEIADGRLIQRFSGHTSFVYAVAFSPDGKRLATGGIITPTRVWDIETGKVLFRFDDGGTYAVRFSPDGKRLATAIETSRLIRVYDTDDGMEHCTLRGHDGQTITVAFTPDGKQLVSGGMDGLIKCWSVETVRPLTVVQKPRPGSFYTWVLGSAFTPDGKRFATASRDNVVRLWTVDGRLVRAWDGPTPRGNDWQDVFWSLAISPDGRQIAAGQGQGRVLRFDPETGRELPPLVHTPGSTVLAVAYSPDGKQLATASGGTVQLWDASTGHPIRMFEAALGTDRVMSLAYSPDGSRMVTGGGNYSWVRGPGVVAVWDLATGRAVFSHPVPHDGVRQVAYNPAGGQVASANSDGSLTVWDSTNGVELKSLQAHSEASQALIFTPDGTRLITSGNGEIKFWDTRDWTQLLTLPNQRTASLGIGDQGRKLVAGSVMPEARLLDATPVSPNLGSEQATRLQRKEHAREERTAAQTDIQNAAILARNGNWEKAAQALSRAARRKQRDPVLSYQHLLALLAAGDLPAYRKAATAALDQYGPAASPEIANDLVWRCCLAEGGHSDPAIPLRLAETAFASYPEAQKPVMLNTLGAALYRAGRFEAAIQRLEEGIKLQNGYSVPQDWAFLAMAHHRLGHRDAARAWLERFKVIGPNQPFSWQIVEIKLLRKEAETLVSGEANPLPQ
jgi:WD40 repeat protein